MKITYTIEGDYHEDAGQFKIITSASDIYLVNIDARNMIRDRLKYQSITADEEVFLQSLQDTLYVEGVDY